MGRLEGFADLLLLPVMSPRTTPEAPTATPATPTTEPATVTPFKYNVIAVRRRTTATIATPHPGETPPRLFVAEGPGLNPERLSERLVATRALMSRMLVLLVSVMLMSRVLVSVMLVVPRPGNP